MKKGFGIFTVMMCIALLSHAKTEKDVSTSEPFSKLKQLQGQWIGTQKTEKGEEKVPVEFSLSSGNTILVEKIFPGTEKEMISVYHAAGDGVMMTHYCMLGNQPRMQLSKSDGNMLHFKFKDGANMKKKDTAMRELKVTFNDAQSFTQEWALYENGKFSRTETFHFVRKK